MKRNRSATLAMLMLGWLLATPSQAATITLVADVWCPYNCEPGSDKPGFMIEIAQKVFGEAGHTVDYRNLPWSRAIDEARKGRFDGIVGAAKDDAPDFTYPDNSLGVSTTVFAVRKGDPWKFTGIESLAGVSVGTIQDYSYSEEFDAYVAANVKDSSKIQVATGEDALDINMRKLEAKRLGAFVEDRFVLDYELGVQGKAGSFDTAGDLGDSDLFIGFSPAKPESAGYAKLLGEGMAKLRASGELARILARYGVKDWKQ